MKRLAIFLVAFLLTVLGGMELAWAESGPLLELEEARLAEAKTQLESSHLVIDVKDQKFLIEQEPNLERMRQSLGLSSTGESAAVDPLEAYRQLPPEKQEKFQRDRLVFLQNAARVINSTKYIMGAGSLVGDAFTFVKVKGAKVFGKDLETEAKEKRSFKERSRKIAEGILQSIDYKLWSQAPLVIDANEFGVHAQVGVFALTGVREKGFGGGEFMGLSFAYNKENRAFVFEIQHTSESFTRSQAATGVLGLAGFMGMDISRKDLAHPVEVLRGNSFYPPAAPIYSLTGPNHFSAGIASTLGLPPPPLADLMTWEDNHERRALLRITVSPVMKGFVRIQLGDFKGSFKVVTFKVVDALRALAVRVLPLHRRACHSVFAS